MAIRALIARRQLVPARQEGPEVDLKAWGRKGTDNRLPVRRYALGFARWIDAFVHEIRCGVRGVIGRAATGSAGLVTWPDSPVYMGIASRIP